METTVADLTLEQKVGQLFHVGFPGTEPTDEIRSLIREYHVGGVIYFSRNLETPEQTRTLSRSLQRTALEEGAEIPLFLSVDQEGGTVRRLPYYTETPGAMAAGATDDPDAAETVARVTAAQLRSVGINCNLAPVLDVNNNPDNPVIGVRSYGEDPDEVATFGERYLEALQSADVVACGKHFPGHGDTSTDSHAELPVVDADGDRLEDVEFRPFERAIDAGIDAIMTAHVAFPAITGSETKPATLSRAVLTDLLRDRLGFDGLLTTDCMEMNAIADTVGTERGAVEAIAAGADVVLVSHSADRQRRAIEAVLEAVETGELAEDRIDESVERILTLKSRRDLRPERSGAESDPAADSDLAALRDLSRDAVTLVRGEFDTALPFDPDEPLYIVGPRTTGGSPAAETQSALDVLAAQLTDRGFETHVLEVDREEPADLSSIPVGSQLLCCAANVARNPAQASALERLLDASHSPVVVSVNNPYDVHHLPAVEPFLTTYDPSAGNLRALVDVLVGDERPRGRPPASLR
ncbi:beta-N-acetylhexosaminidase [Natronobacterium texcoconense]|uniref:Beta-N-acetylhexosaminidase n=1 Tax=Natronobacterium texcoconense TaxID=1095778 RepID=A0A1H1FU64_NATTX|nr:beta-N-acetylhexosaminidase [Natronobacterium texcoconense]SDR04547.1 beta-N-acetylhexosaminidase [Natronobacterium texcoconense]